MKRSWWLLAGLLLVGLAARLVYVDRFVGLAAPPEYDGVDYDLLARNLQAGLGYTLYFGPTAFRPPGYPLLLAGVYALTCGSWAAVRVLQALAGTATIVATYLLALRALERERPALIAAAGVAVHPVLLYLAGIVYPEVVTGLLVVTAAVLMGPSLAGRPLGFGRAAGIGLLLGAAVLLRPAVLLFAVLVAAYAAWQERRDKRLPVRSALIPGIALLLLLPWSLRNLRTFGEWIPLATEGGVTFWGGNNALADGGNEYPSAETWEGPNPPAGQYGWPGLSETESEDRFYAAALDWIQREPTRWLRLLPQKLARSWTLAFGNEARDNPLPGWIGTIYLLYPLSVAAGLVLSWRHRRKLVAVYALLVAQTLTTLAFYGSTRQSALIIPCALVLSACAVDRLLSLVLPAKKGRGADASACAGRIGGE